MKPNGHGKGIVMSDKKSGHFEILEGFPPDVVAISAIGRIDRAAYEKQLIPLIEEHVAREGKVNLLYILGPEFEGYTAGAAWDDAKLGLLHLTDFARIAVVSDIEWIRLAVKMFAPLLKSRMRLFHLSELDQAKEWIQAYRPEQDDDKIEVAADHKIPPLEDMTPPT